MANKITAQAFASASLIAVLGRGVAIDAARNLARARLAEKLMGAVDDGALHTVQVIERQHMSWLGCASRFSRPSTEIEIDAIIDEGLARPE